MSAGLGEYKIRDLNDEINKLSEVKNLIGKIVLKNSVELILKKQHQKCLDNEGKEVPGNRGYK